VGKDKQIATIDVFSDEESKDFDAYDEE